MGTTWCFANPWTMATRYDAYFGFLNFFGWLAWGERSLGTTGGMVRADPGGRQHCYVAVRAITAFQVAAGRACLPGVPAESGMNQGFLYPRLMRPVLELLRQGITPEKIALSLALGVALGVFPVLGSTTALCALAAFALQLNLPAIQIVNYFVYPLQIALLIPLFRLGEKLFRAPHLPLSVPQIYAMMHVHMGNTMRSLWATTWHAIVVWCLIAPLGVAALYAALTPALRRAARRQIPRIAEAA